MTRLWIVTILLIVLAAVMQPAFTIYEDGSFNYLGQNQGCLPWAICAEGE